MACQAEYSLVVKRLSSNQEMQFDSDIPLLCVSVAERWGNGLQNRVTLVQIQPETLSDV